MKSSSLLTGLTIGLLVLFAGCKKHSEDMVAGTWELVNVADIEAPHTTEWVFEDGNLRIYQRSKANPEDLTLIDTGYYILESTPFKTTIRLLNTSNSLWNNHWDVVQLDGSFLILHMDIPGGVLFKEFVKIQ
ncbi:MAG: hypothetical protein K0B37_13285 [Bacteroidales bacterium]|nr:hypothetical protein [Bacteroidales bacterium]